MDATNTESITREEHQKLETENCRNRTSGAVRSTGVPKRIPYPDVCIYGYIGTDRGTHIRSTLLIAFQVIVK